MMKIISSSRASILLWIMALFAIVGCSDWIDTPTTSNPNSMEHAPTIVTDAQRLLEQRGEFFLLNMSLRDGKVREKSKATATSSKKPQSTMGQIPPLQGSRRRSGDHPH